MPSKSPKQHRFMEAVAHNPDFAQTVGVPVKVGQDFAAADKTQSRFTMGQGMNSALHKLTSFGKKKPRARGLTAR